MQAVWSALICQESNLGYLMPLSGKTKSFYAAKFNFPSSPQESPTCAYENNNVQVIERENINEINTTTVCRTAY